MLSVFDRMHTKHEHTYSGSHVSHFAVETAWVAAKNGLPPHVLHEEGCLKYACVSGTLLRF